MLAVGSNGSPGQLRHKFRGQAASDLVPVTAVTVHGITVGHSAHISTPGYVPYAPMAAGQDAARALPVLWLDDAQLAHIDAAEGRGYRPTTLEGEAFPAVLASGTRLPAYRIYRSRCGMLRPAPQQPAVPAGSQVAVFEVMARWPWFRALVPACSRGAGAAAAALRDDRDLRDRVREAMAEGEMAADDGLPAAA